jgi:AraC-like DNA-binding protein
VVPTGEPCLRVHRPLPPLGDFVEMLWIWRGSAAQPHAFERLLPTGTVELVVNLREDTSRIYDPDDRRRFEVLPGSLLVGPQSEYFVIDTAEQREVMGVHFRPGGASPFTGPAGELTDAHVPLEALWGSAGRDLRERLLEADSDASRFRILASALLAQAQGALERHPAVAHALEEFGRVPHARRVAEVRAGAGLSHRRFVQLFRDAVGLTPKLYCRIRRFQEVLQRVAAGRAIEWAGLALDCGYYDQAHFIRDFRAFSGLNPSTYLVDRGEHLNHVPLRG